MEFQFLCPQGHLLQADLSLAGQQCKCPYCEMIFLVPQPAPAPSVDANSASEGETGYQQPTFQQPPAQPQGETFPAIITEGSAGRCNDPADTQIQAIAAGAAGQSILHIACPSGHRLETPREMLGQDAMCPYCQLQFRLRLEDSEEYRREKTEEQELRERKLGRAWLNWAITAAVLVALVLIALVVITVKT